MSKLIILGVSGRMQSGKTTTYLGIASAWDNHFHAHKSLPIVAVEEFSMAKHLKRFCVDVLGLKPEQVDGTNEQKNSVVPHLLWENFPVPGVANGRSGPMTGRQVMEAWGTQIFRRSDPDIWLRKSLADILDRERQIRELPGIERRLIAIIPDVRFPNEVKGIQEQGGYVLRLTRNPYPESTHECETALDPDKFNWARFDKVYDNSQEDAEAQMRGLAPWLREIGVL